MRPALLVLSVLIIASGHAGATPASEAHPDCEEGQPWIGYRSLAPFFEPYDEAGAPGGLHLCEGEHWDGQDPVTGDDPNEADGADALRPVEASLRTDGASVHASARVAFASRVALYADGSTIALYWRDDTPLNLLFVGVQALRLTHGYAAEGDCDQAAYPSNAIGMPRCGRDNTAITLEHGLLP